MIVKLNKAIGALLLTGSMMTGGGALAGEPPKSMLGNTCAGCHGTNGVSAGVAMPAIAGLPEDYLREVMLQFRSGERYSTIMGRIAKGYSDRNIDAMSSFFAEQDWVSIRQKIDPVLVRRGEKIHLKKCEACHRDNGRSTDNNMARLGGQWPGYIHILMQAYRQPEIRIPQPDAMKILVRQLNEDDIQALAHFYAAQH